MLRTPGQRSAAEGHASRDFTYQSLKKYMNEEGTITIDREDIEPAVEKESVPVQTEVKQTAAEKTEQAVEGIAPVNHDDMLKVNGQLEVVAVAA
jgi:hypothetical protein